MSDQNLISPFEREQRKQYRINYLQSLDANNFTIDHNNKSEFSLGSIVYSKDDQLFDKTYQYGIGIVCSNDTAGVKDIIVHFSNHSLLYYYKDGRFMSGGEPLLVHLKLKSKLIISYY